MHEKNNIKNLHYAVFFDLAGLNIFFSALCSDTISFLEFINAIV
jgi:hypothetical protein